MAMIVRNHVSSVLSYLGDFVRVNVSSLDNDVALGEIIDDNFVFDAPWVDV